MISIGASIRQPSAQDERVGQLVEELSARLQAGESVDCDLFVAEHPECAEQLRRLLPAIQALADLGYGGVAPASAMALPEQSGPTPGMLGDYRIVREIGRGGMGVVYEAEQLSLGRRVALKVLPFAAALDERQLRRFKNEAHAAAQLHHTNIVPLYAVGCERGVHYYAMQYIEGQTLASVIHEMRRREGLEGNEKKSAGQPLSRIRDDLATGSFTPSFYASAEHVPAAPAPDLAPVRSYELAAAPSDATDTAPIAAVSTERSSKSPGFFRTAASLGIQAAEALEHAHELGVIHRDVKPANLIVDARGNVWITDFGLAQIQGETKLTMTGDLLGTLRYMSPEQALARQVLLDHRTDVYSLGATLYELLTLSPVFASENRQELLRQIAFEEPRPLRQINKAIPVELETIVLKLLEKSQSDRYTSAQEVANDLRRFLEDKPIQARRPTTLARVRKWTRRHRRTVTAALVSSMLVLVATSAVIGWQWRVSESRRLRAEDAETMAETRRVDAERSKKKAQAINDFLIKEMFAAGTPEVAQGHKVTAEEVLDKAAAKIDDAFPEQPEVEAQVRQAIGAAYNSLALYSKAEPHLRRALTIQQELRLAEEPETLEIRKELGELWIKLGKYAEGERLHRQSLETASRILGADHRLTLQLDYLVAWVVDAQAKWHESEALLRQCLGRQIRVLGEEHPDTLDTMRSLAETLGKNCKWQEAEPLGRRCLEIRERVLGKNHPDTLDTRAGFAAAILRTEGKWKEAETLLRETLEIARRVYGPKHHETLNIQHDLGLNLWSLDRLDEAETCFRDTIEIRSGYSSPEHPETLNSAPFLAYVLLAQGKLDEAEGMLGKIYEASRRVRGPFDNATLNAMAGIGLLHQARGRWAVAESTLRQAVAARRVSPGPRHLATLRAIGYLAVLLDETDKHREAGALFRDLLEAWGNFPPNHPERAFALCDWGEHLLAEGSFRRAEPVLTEALGIERVALPPEHRAIGQSLAVLGWLRAQTGRAQEGEQLLRESLSICRRAWPAAHWRPADAASQLGGCLTALGQYSEAEKLLLASYQTLQDAEGTPPSRGVKTMDRIIKLYETWGKPDAAAGWRAKSLEQPPTSEKGTWTRKRK
jgi:serine/threonine protein kinase/tetratricopeptide (TPR) repeat protein